MKQKEVIMTIIIIIMTIIIIIIIIIVIIIMIQAPIAHERGGFKQGASFGRWDGQNRLGR